MKEDPSWNKRFFHGDKGTVTSISENEAFNERQIWIKFDSGYSIALIEGIDKFEIIKE